MAQNCIVFKKIRKWRKNLFFAKFPSPEMTSQSFAVSCFCSHGFVPHRRWKFAFSVHQNMGKENRCRIFLKLFLSVHSGEFNNLSSLLLHAEEFWRNKLTNQGTHAQHADARTSTNSTNSTNKRHAQMHKWKRQCSRANFTRHLTR